jgi:hypothetical protein
LGIGLAASMQADLDARSRAFVLDDSRGAATARRG